MAIAKTGEWRMNAFLDHEDDAALIANPIHSTEFARVLGFTGPLVGGATVWGRSVSAILTTLGGAWLDQGWARFRFRQPVYPGDELRITLSPQNGDAFFLRIANSDGVECVLGEVGLGPNPSLVNFQSPNCMDPAPPPDPRPELRVTPSLVGFSWIPMATDASAETLRTYMQHSHRSEASPFGGKSSLLHPAWLVGRAEALMRHNFNISSSIHTQSEVEFLAASPPGGEVIIGGHCSALYERKGRPFVEFDCLIRGSDGRDLVRMRHTTIFDATAGVS